MLLPPVKTDLPIEEAIPQLRDVLRAHTSAVLQAPPGAGKTTRVPLALLDEPWLEARRIVMLEPRRLAARAAAARMASTLGERVGETVGYRVRMDTRVGPRTRIEVVTEGVLTRLLQSDPTMQGVGLVVFDEFHERSLHADLGLALCLQARELLRDDLRILVMSATLDGGSVAALLGRDGGAGPAPIVTSEGKSYPVETRYRARPVEGWIEPLVARAVQDALESDPGDLLVFLPGAGEILRVQERLRDANLPVGVQVFPLYGNLSQEIQDRAIQPAPPGVRKVVLSTSIAETSLTIEGVRVVIDSGRMRVPRFDPRIGMSRLETITVSRASADQRRGRAGRVAPGVCYRLWTESEQHQLVPFSAPEILDADLAPLALDLALWGVSDPASLRWLDPPPGGAFAQARELLRELGALDALGSVTSHGRRMAELPLHPRLAHMILTAESLGRSGLACEMAALLAERDLFRRDGNIPDVDLRLRLDALHQVQRGGRGSAPGDPVDRGMARRIAEEARQLCRRAGVRDSGSDRGTDAVGLLLALAFPDRIAQRRTGGGGRFLLRNGRGASLPGAQTLESSAYLVAAELDGQGKESRILLAAPIELQEMEEHFADQIQQLSTVGWDPEVQAVRARKREQLGALVLREGPLLDPEPEAVTDALLEGVEREGLQMLPWSREARQLQQRLIFLRRLDASWPDVSDASLAASLNEWLRPFVHGLRRRDDLQRLDLANVLLAQLPWERRRELDEQAPTHLEVPSGSRITIDYGDPQAPVLAVRLQEVFGLRETPRIARGRVPLTLHLLSPAQRPVQVTRDLASFWRSTYFEVKKDLKGRYPKHYWPEDPLQAAPTRRTRPPGS